MNPLRFLAWLLTALAECGPRDRPETRPSAQASPALEDLHDRLMAKQANLPEVQFSADEIKAIFTDD